MKFGKLSGYKLNGQNVMLNFEGQEASIQVITSKIINVFCGLESADHHSKAIEGEKAIPVTILVEEKEDGLWIKTEDVFVRVNDGFYVDFFNNKGEEVCMDWREGRQKVQVITDEHMELLIAEGHDYTAHETEHAFDILKKMQGTEHFYGLGDKTGYLDKRNYGPEKGMRSANHSGPL